MAIRRLNVGKGVEQRKTPNSLKPFKTLTMFKNEEDLLKEVERLKKSYKEVNYQISPTLKIMYR